MTSASWCETLLRQIPGCAWLLKRDAVFHAVYGDATRVFGRPGADLEGRNFADLFEARARPSWLARVERVFSGETLCTSARFGESATFSLSIFPVRLTEGDIAFAGGLARETPEGNLVLRTLDALETERAQMSQLLHDRAGNLSAAGLQLDLLQLELAGSGIAAAQRIGEIQTILENDMGLVREVYREFNPASAGRVGLAGALELLGGRLRAEFQGEVRVLADATAQPSGEAASALYRIAQEAAGQAVRRAGCSAIEILLESSPSGPRLEIRDNGAGFAGEDGGLEILVMQHFADRAGIELEIDSGLDKGTVVRALCRPVGG
jgi:signal transduction histidine kinase